jgi:hypothetical protein
MAHLCTLHLGEFRCMCLTGEVPPRNRAERRAWASKRRSVR